MNWKNMLDRFDFDDQHVVYQYIQTQTTFQPLTLVDNLDFRLPGYREPSRFQFDRKSFFVEEFQKTGAKLFVHFDRRADNFMG